MTNQELPSYAIEDNRLYVAKVTLEPISNPISYPEIIGSNIEANTGGLTSLTQNVSKQHALYFSSLASGEYSYVGEATVDTSTFISYTDFTFNSTTALKFLLENARKVYTDAMEDVLEVDTGGPHRDIEDIENDLYWAREDEEDKKDLKNSTYAQWEANKNYFNSLKQELENYKIATNAHAAQAGSYENQARSYFYVLEFNVKYHNEHSTTGLGVKMVVPTLGTNYIELFEYFLIADYANLRWGISESDQIRINNGILAHSTYLVQAYDSPNFDVSISGFKKLEQHWYLANQSVGNYKFKQYSNFVRDMHNVAVYLNRMYSSKANAKDAEKNVVILNGQIYYYRYNVLDPSYDAYNAALAAYRAAQDIVTALEAELARAEDSEEQYTVHDEIERIRDGLRITLISISFSESIPAHIMYASSFKEKECIEFTSGNITKRKDFNGSGGTYNYGGYQAPGKVAQVSDKLLGCFVSKSSVAIRKANGNTSSPYLNYTGFIITYKITGDSDNTEYVFAGDINGTSVTTFNRAKTNIGGSCLQSIPLKDKNGFTMYKADAVAMSAILKANYFGLEQHTYALHRLKDASGFNLGSANAIALSLSTNILSGTISVNEYLVSLFLNIHNAYGLSYRGNSSTTQNRYRLEFKERDSSIVMLLSGITTTSYSGKLASSDITATTKGDDSLIDDTGVIILKYPSSKNEITELKIFGLEFQYISTEISHRIVTSQDPYSENNSLNIPLVYKELLNLGMLNSNPLISRTMGYQSIVDSEDTKITWESALPRLPQASTVFSKQGERIFYGLSGVNFAMNIASPQVNNTSDIMTDVSDMAGLTSLVEPIKTIF